MRSNLLLCCEALAKRTNKSVLSDVIQQIVRKLPVILPARTTARWSEDHSVT